MPEQRMQTKTPRFQLAHRGSVVAPLLATVLASHLLREVTRGHTLVALAVCADFVRIEAQQLLDGRLVLGCLGSLLVGRRPSRHDSDSTRPWRLVLDFLLGSVRGIRRTQETRRWDPGDCRQETLGCRCRVLFDECGLYLV